VCQITNDFHQRLRYGYDKDSRLRGVIKMIKTAHERDPDVPPCKLPYELGEDGLLYSVDSISCASRNLLSPRFSTRPMTRWVMAVRTVPYADWMDWQFHDWRKKPGRMLGTARIASKTLCEDIYPTATDTHPPYPSAQSHWTSLCACLSLGTATIRCSK
jgi:hypothetical protein